MSVFLTGEVLFGLGPAPTRDAAFVKIYPQLLSKETPATSNMLRLSRTAKYHMIDFTSYVEFDWRVRGRSSAGCLVTETGKKQNPIRMQSAKAKIFVKSYEIGLPEEINCLLKIRYSEFR